MQGSRVVGRFRGCRIPGVLRGLGSVQGMGYRRYGVPGGVGYRGTDIHAFFGVW